MYPVPPYLAVIVDPAQVPVEIVPTAVREELVTPVPNEVAERTELPFIL